MANRIDVHSHFLPPDYLAALRNAGIRDVDGYPLPQWTVDSGLAAMDQNGIGAAVISVSSPALHFVDGDAARELARSVNESARALITAHPDRFAPSHFCRCPMSMRRCGKSHMPSIPSVSTESAS
jgi:hypothetical protein